MFTVNFDSHKFEKTSSGHYCVPIRIVSNKVGVYGQELIFVAWPTNNCQIASISPLGHLLQYEISYENLCEIFTSLVRKMGGSQKILLFDVKERHDKVLRTYPKEMFLVKENYISTNNSSMVMGLLKMN